MKKLITALLLCTITSLYSRAQQVSLTDTEFKQLKSTIEQNEGVKKMFTRFQATADKALNEKPNPIEEITSEGMLDGNPDKIASLKAVEDADKIYALALVYKLYNNKVYLNKATEFLLAWAKVNKSSGDPIDETKLENLYTGYDAIRNDIAPDERKTIDNWLDSIAAGEANSEYAQGMRSTAINNWNSHRIKIIAMIAYSIHTKKYDGVIKDGFTKQLIYNLYPDGSGYDFAERDALHYHIYTLEPLLQAAIAIYRATGKNYFTMESPKGASVKKSVDFLVPFVTGEKTHGEFLNSKVPFDRERAKNGQKEYTAGSLFHPSHGLGVLALASYFDGQYLAVIQKVAKSGTDNSWQLVLNKIRKPTGMAN